MWIAWRKAKKLFDFLSKICSGLHGALHSTKAADDLVADRLDSTSSGR